MAQPSLKTWNLRARRRLARLARLAESMAKTGQIQGIPRLRGGIGRVEVVLVSAAEMTRLNASFRGKRYATDILSFPPPPDFGGVGFLGELVICLPTLVRQARERGLTLEMELEILLAHGLLHLLGLDHERGPRHEQKMARAEQRLLEAAVPRAWLLASRGRCVEGLIERVLRRPKPSTAEKVRPRARELASKKGRFNRPSAHKQKSSSAFEICRSAPPRVALKNKLSLLAPLRCMLALKLRGKFK